MHVLDLDLDFFLDRVVYRRKYDDGRVGAGEASPWAIEEAVAWLEERCGLETALPGVAVESHGEVFHLWRSLISEAVLGIPFSVTHVDAHADLGYGDASCLYLMTELLFEDPENRSHPQEGGLRGLSDGNYLAFAIANGWVSELVYVYCDGGENGQDVPRTLMENFDQSAANIELKAMHLEQFRKVPMSSIERPDVAHREPLVPLRRVPAHSFQAEEAFNLIFLARSPNYTPVASDVLYDIIRERFIDESKLGRVARQP